MIYRSPKLKYDEVDEDWQDQSKRPWLCADRLNQHFVMDTKIPFKICMSADFLEANKDAHTLIAAYSETSVLRSFELVGSYYHFNRLIEFDAYIMNTFSEFLLIPRRRVVFVWLEDQ